MSPLSLVVCVGVFAMACGELTSDQITKFRTNGVLVADNGDSYTFSHVGLPTHTMGSFPNADNPNAATAQNHEFEVPKTPTRLAEPGCLNMGPIGVTVNGIPMFNPFTFEGTNAVENEVFDSCSGHPDPTGTYHYHMLPNCVYQGGEDEMVGVALDGYLIYGPKSADGTTLTSADLDQCHGQTRNGQYEYRITEDFPYILGCFMGETLMGGEGPERPEGEEDGERPERPEGEEEDGERPERPEGGMERDWSICYALVGCENPSEQVGDEVCGNGADGMMSGVIMAVLLSLAAAWIM